MTHDRLTPGAAAHWGKRYAVVLDDGGDRVLIAPIWTPDEIRADRADTGRALALDALDRGDLEIDRDALGLSSSGDRLVIRCGECRTVRADALIPFAQLPFCILAEIVRLRRGVDASREAERGPPVASTMFLPPASRGRMIGRRGVS